MYLEICYAIRPVAIAMYQPEALFRWYAVTYPLWHMTREPTWAIRQNIHDDKIPRVLDLVHLIWARKHKFDFKQVKLFVI